MGPKKLELWMLTLDLSMSVILWCSHECYDYFVLHLRKILSVEIFIAIQASIA